MSLINFYDIEISTRAYVNTTSSDFFIMSSARALKLSPDVKWSTLQTFFNEPDFKGKAQVDPPLVLSLYSP